MEHSWRNSLYHQILHQLFLLIHSPLQSKRCMYFSFCTTIFWLFQNSPLLTSKSVRLWIHAYAPWTWRKCLCQTVLTWKDMWPVSVILTGQGLIQWLPLLLQQFWLSSEQVPLVLVKLSWMKWLTGLVFFAHFFHSFKEPWSFFYSPNS